MICLVRGETSKAAQERVHKALLSRGLNAAPERYSVLTARLGRADLGMDTGAFEELLEEADIVIHVSTAQAPRCFDCSDLRCATGGLGCALW